MAAGFPCEIVRAEVDSGFSKEQLVDVFIRNGKTVCEELAGDTSQACSSLKPFQEKNLHDYSTLLIVQWLWSENWEPQ